MKNITHINGKKLPKSHLNLLAKLADKHGVTLATEKAKRTNPFTGAAHELEPLAVSLFDFIVPNYHAGKVIGSTVESMTKGTIPTNTWNSARYMFQTYWPTEYFDLID